MGASGFRLVQLLLMSPILFPCAEILITNDDGIHSPALRELELALSDLGKVTIVAPDRSWWKTDSAILSYRVVAGNATVLLATSASTSFISIDIRKA